MCQNIHFLFKKTHTNENQKKLKKREKKESKEKQKKNAVFVNRICGKSNGIQWFRLQICSVYFYYEWSSNKRECVPKNKIFVYFYLLYFHDENQDMLMPWKHLYLYILFTLAFQLLILKWSNFVACRLLHCIWVNLKKKRFSYNAF